MNFSDYYGLRERAKAAGVEDSPSLKMLLHLLQAKEVAVKHHRDYLMEMNNWERNCFKCVEDEIKKAGGVE